MYGEREAEGGRLGGREREREKEREKGGKRKYKELTVAIMEAGKSKPTVQLSRLETKESLCCRR